VEAVVSEAPTLLYYANREGKGRLEVVGKVFEPQGYGLALPQGSRLREKLNLAVLGLQQSSEFKNIRLKWFGPQAGR
jgi:ABC-type amino acid transport substrate-binding protein